jgi:hypothetical protein
VKLLTFTTGKSGGSYFQFFTRVKEAIDPKQLFLSTPLVGFWRLQKKSKFKSPTKGSLSPKHVGVG